MPVRKPASRITASVAELRRLIATDFSPGDRLPAEVELAATLGVSRVTVREALRQLWVEGAVIRRWGVGTFVGAADAAGKSFTDSAVNLNDIGSLPAQIRDSGHEPSLAHAEVGKVRASGTVAAALGLRARQTVWRIERCLAIDGVPTVVLHDHAPTTLNGRPFDPSALSSIEVDVPTLFRAAGMRLVRMDATYDVCTADDEIAALLEVPVGRPLLHARQDSYADTGSLVLTTEGFYRTDNFALRVVRTIPE